MVELPFDEPSISSSVNKDDQICEPFMSTDQKICTKTGLDIVLTSHEGIQIEHDIRFNFNISINEAEHKAFIVGIKWTLVLKIDHIRVYNDSKLIVYRILDDYATREQIQSNTWTWSAIWRNSSRSFTLLTCRMKTTAMPILLHSWHPKSTRAYNAPSLSKCRMNHLICKYENPYLTMW